MSPCCFFKLGESGTKIVFVGGVKADSRDFVQAWCIVLEVVGDYEGQSQRDG
jgi:hypothetical protein